MSQSLRTIKRRIRSVENTRKITQAMEMVSGAKLKKSEAVLRQGAPYFLKLEAMLKDLLCGIETSAHPFLEERGAKKIGLCVIVSDTGLCSTYNDNILLFAEDFIRERPEAKIELVVVGRKALGYFKKRNLPVIQSYTGLKGMVSQGVCDEITQVLTRTFLSKEADEIYVIHTRFISALKYAPVVEKFLNIECSGAEEMKFIFEPQKNKILEELMPKYVLAKLRFMLLSSFTSEHSARMIAMKAATDNADAMIDNLTLLRNKARQSSITKEIIEVSSAAELLKG